MSHALMQRELLIDAASGDFEIRPITDKRIIGPVDYGWARFQQDADSFCWGGGPLAGSPIPGTRRLVFTGYSPAWEGFYISSLGGGAYVSHRVGVDFVCLRGRCDTDSVLILNHREGEIEVRFEPIDPDVVWANYAGADETKRIGFYALQQAVFDRYHAEYSEDWVRVFAVGPAARFTNQGVIGSNYVRHGEITPVDDWAGRGGLGSRLLQYHRVAACIFGGEWEDPDLKDSKEIDGYFLEYFGQKAIRTDIALTAKYRYVPEFETGGTFGVNMRNADDTLFSYNYSSVGQPAAARREQHQRLVLDHYLAQFNEQIIKPKSFSHCGEPCPVACKKMHRHYKKDYEPYQALGPQCGIFDQRAAERINYMVDAMGFDAIQMGGMVSWIMELVSQGLLPARDFGLPPAEALRFAFTAGEDFDVVEDSARNADYAIAVVDMILFSRQGEPFRRGIRAAAGWLDEVYGVRSRDCAVYLAHGREGGLVPNQYWVPGMFSPMPMMGKYFCYYGVEFVPPRQLGRQNVYRMVYELFNENSGACRFHRRWVEVIADDIIRAHYDLEVDYEAHQFELAKEIYAYQGEGVRFWESERVVDIIQGYLERWGEIGLEDAELKRWIARFRKDKWTAARAYWEEVAAGIEEAFAAGPGAIPRQLSPHQAAAREEEE
jgi:glyceraldehyde-3-phosphate dehydrogenase (ferredoxin)